MNKSKDTSTVEVAVEKMRLYMHQGENYYDFYELPLDNEVPSDGAMLIKNDKTQILVIKQNSNCKIEALYETNKDACIKILKTYKNKNFIIIYRDIDYAFISYLLDFFTLYVNMPNKIKQEDF